MFDVFFIISLFSFAVFCFLEIIIFNEEVLLALCFFSFIFFIFNAMNATIFDIFHSRATKFESDLLISFNAAKNSISDKFLGFLASRYFVFKLKIMLSLVSDFLSTFLVYSTYNQKATFYSLCCAKLLELAASENKLLAAFRKKTVSLLLYPLIFKSASNSSFILDNSLNSTSSFPAKIAILKSIS